MNRFRGSLIALVVVVAVGAAWWINQEPPPEPEPEPEQIFTFEKEDLIGIRVERPGDVIELVKEEGTWTVVGDTWKPSRSMIRRIGHQIHDLQARATVATDVERQEFAQYGLGPEAIHVQLTLEGGRTIGFRAGDPNPTSVSWYLKPDGSDAVYIVKKAAIDYYRLDLSEFREKRFASLDADEADRIEAVVDGRRLALHRTGAKAWRMTEPVEQDAARSEVRTMLGRVAALKAQAFVEDEPQDLSKYGLDAPAHEVTIGLSTGETVTLKIGDTLPDTDPVHAYLYRVEDRAVYEARVGFLDAYRLDVADYRKRELLGRSEDEVTALVVRKGDQELTLSRTVDGWRWPDGAVIPGSTPRRLAEGAAEFRVMTFVDDKPPAEVGLDEPSLRLQLAFGEERHVIEVGDHYEIELDQSMVDKRFYARLDGGEVVEIDQGLDEVADDLFREYGRKREKDLEKRLEDAAALDTAAGG